MLNFISKTYVEIFALLEISQMQKDKYKGSSESLWKVIIFKFSFSTDFLEYPIIMQFLYVRLPEAGEKGTGG